MKNEKARTPEKIKFEYSHSPSHQIHYANGAYGGLTSKGDIRISFFIEAPKTPHAEIFAIKREALGEKTSIEPEDNYPIITREFQTTVFMSIEHAEAVGNWILDKVKEWKTASTMIEAK